MSCSGSVDWAEAGLRRVGVAGGGGHGRVYSSVAGAVPSVREGVGEWPVVWTGNRRGGSVVERVFSLWSRLSVNWTGSFSPSPWGNEFWRCAWMGSDMRHGDAAELWGHRDTGRMVDLTDLPRLGPYVLTRDLDRCALAERCLALHDVEQTSHLLYRFPTCRDKMSQRRFLEAVELVSKVDHAHVLPIEQFAFDIAYRPWLVTPFPGAAGDVLTLARHVREKGGPALAG